MMKPGEMRLVGRIFGGLALALVFTVSLFAAALLHVGLPAPRRVAAALTARLLSDLFRGGAEIGGVERLGPGGLVASTLRMRDERGAEVIHVRTLEARFNAWGIARNVVFHGDKIDVVIDHVRLDEASVRVEPGPDGTPTIADAFTLRHEEPEAAAPREPSRLRVWFPRIEIGKLEARGKLGQAPTLESSVREARASLLVAPAGVAIDVERFGVVLRGLSGIDVSGIGSFHLRSKGAMWAYFDGDFGQVPAHAFARLDGKKLSARADLPRVDPAAARALFPSWPLHSPVAVMARAAGDLPHLEAEVVANITDGGSLHAKGPVSFADGVDVDVDVDVDALDLRAINPSLPSTSLAARSALELWTDGQTLTLEANGAVEPSLVSGVEVPAIDLRADYGARGLEARATFHELGVPARLTVRVPPTGEVILEGTLKKTRIENSPRLSKLTGARGVVQADVSATVKDGLVNGQLRLESSSLGYGELSLQSAVLTARAHGPTDAPERLAVDAKLDSRGVRIGPLPLTRLGVRVTGPAQAPRIEASGEQEDGTRLTAEGSLSTSPWTLTNAKFAVARRGSEISGSLARGSLHGDHVDVKGFVLESGGKLTADAELSSRKAVVRAKGSDIDLDRIARALNIPVTRLAGHVDVDADLTLGDTSRGKATVRLENASLDSLSGVTLDGTATFDERRTQGDVKGGIEGLGRVTALWNVELSGNALSRKSWLDSVGQSQLALEQLNLGLLATMFGKRFGVERAGGQGYARVSLARSKDNELPHALFVAGTEHLTLSVAREDASPLEVNSLDVSVAGALNGATSKVELSGRLFDFRGDLATLSAEMPADLKVLVPAALRGDLDAELREREFRAILLVPDRSIEQLPSFLRPKDVSGRFSGRAVVAGTFASPEATLSLSVKNLMGSATPVALPVGLETAVRYTKATGKLVGSVQVQQARKRVAWGTFDLLVPFEHLVAPLEPETPLWTGNAQLLLDGAPLSMLALLAERKVSGDVQGSVNVSRKEWMPELRTDLTLRHLVVADTEVGEGRVVAESSKIDIIARARFEDEYGALTGALQTRLVPSPLFVTLERDSPVYVTLESHKYDAVVLSPLVRSILPELSGALDGTLRATLSPPPPRQAPKKGAAASEQPQEAEPWSASFEGHVRLSNGVVAPAGLGLRLLDTSVAIEAKREGDLNVVYLNDIAGRAESEKRNFHGRGALWFEDLELVRGKFELEQQNVPFNAGGTQLASVSGRIDAELELEREKNEMNVSVNIPSLTAELPDQEEHTVIEIEDNPDVVILQPLGPPTEAEETDAPKTPWNVRIQLGKDVRVTSRLMDIRLRGEPEVRLAEETAMTGSVELVPGGRIQVMGRVFFIDQGRVAFDTAEPSNPHLDVSATWRAPNGVLVRANVRGTAKKPELSWESDPALPGGEQAIVALVLGTGGGEGGQGSGAGLAGGAAIVNELLGRTGVQNIEVFASRETGAGTTGQVASLSERTWDSYTAAYRISDEIWFEGSFRQESTALEAEQRSGFSGAIDWRFRRDWSLRTEVGTLGGGIDLLWQYSY